MLNEIKTRFEELCEGFSGIAENKRLVRLRRGTSGSAAGLPFEDWAFKELQGRLEDLNVKVLKAADFAKTLSSSQGLETQIKRSGERKGIHSFIQRLREATWWFEIQQLTENSILRIRKGEWPKISASLRRSCH